MAGTGNPRAFDVGHALGPITFDELLEQAAARRLLAHREGQRNRIGLRMRGVELGVLRDRAVHLERGVELWRLIGTREIGALRRREFADVVEPVEERFLPTAD